MAIFPKDSLSFDVLMMVIKKHTEMLKIRHWCSIRLECDDFEVIFPLIQAYSDHLFHMNRSWDRPLPSYWK